MSASKTPRIYYHDIALADADVQKLIRHWNLDRDFNETERYHQLQQTLKTLAPMHGGDQIFNNIVGRGQKDTQK